MARRNKGEVGILALVAAAAGGLWLLTKKKSSREPSHQPGLWPGEQETGWAVNQLCTNADLTDVEAATVHAYAWRTGRKLPPAVSRAQIEATLAAYFSSIFPQCADGHLDAVFHTDGMLKWDDWVSAVAAVGGSGDPFAVGASAQPLVDVGAAILGY